MFFDFLSEDTNGAIALQYGEVITGSIDSLGDVNIYTFEGTSGDAVRFSMNMTSGTLDPLFDVFRPDGTLLCDTQTTGILAQVDCTLDATGTHTILVGD